jgi:hypothetical protein
MPYKRGDVVLVLFPDSNLRTAKRRPALIIQADDLNTGLPQSALPHKSHYRSIFEADSFFFSKVEITQTFVGLSLRRASFKADPSSA